MRNKVMKILFGFVTVMILMLGVSPSTVHASSITYGLNLVTNGDGEGDFAAWDKTDSTDFKDETYSAAGIPSSTQGGYIFDLIPTPSSNLTQSITQTIDVSSISADIFTEKVTLELSAEIYKMNLSDVASISVTQIYSTGSAMTNIQESNGTGWQTKSFQIGLNRRTVTLIVTLKGVLAAESNPVAFDNINLTLFMEPSVTTQAVSDITTTTATGNGNITDLGEPYPTAYGICWGTSVNPTTSDSVVNMGAASTTGPFTASMVGLAPNTTYYVRAYVTNMAGTRYGSSVSFTTNGVPGAPTGISATPGNGQASVSFTAPASNGGSAITGYTVTSNPGGLTGTGTGSPIIVTGLTNGTAYTFTVTATNAIGTSSASTASTAVTPAIVPGVPTGVSATPGDGRATISFTAPANNGGSAITGYTVTSNPGGHTGTGAGTSIVVTGLTNGTAYTFTVTATNAIGTGSVSTASTAVTPATVPGAPIGVSATTGDGRATVSFTAPASNGGSAITGYTVTSNPGGLTGTGTGSPIVVTGLTNGTAYTFTVTATNAIGTSSASTASTAVTPVTVPGAPTGVSATAGDGRATISFTAPASNGGSAITGYTVTSNPGGHTGTGTGLSIVVTGLTNGTAYTFTVTATNAIGTGLASTASTAVTPATVPGAPTGVSATPGNGQASVSFTAPASNGGSTITGYTVTSNPGGHTGTGAGTSIVVSGLTNGTAYTFTVVATNTMGNSIASSATSAATPATVPGAPTGVSATAGDGQATVSFTAPASNGGSAIARYTVTSNPGGLTGTGTGTSIVVSGLTNGTAYTFTVVATNAKGNSAVSSATSAVTPVVATPATPSAPAVTASPTVVPTETKITIEVKQGESDKTATQISIDRSTDDKGKKADTVTFDSDKAAETVAKMTGSSETVARIIIPDTKDEVSETTVKVPTKAVEELVKGKVGLQIDTEDAKLNIAQDSMLTASKNMDKDLYFNLVPVKDEEQKKELTERAVVQVGILGNTEQSGITVVGVPVAIETNMSSTAVNITLPLTGITLPTDSAEKEAFLNQLAVYIEHSDGTKELVKGKLVEYKNGVMGIEFPVTKFSTFTIVHTDVFTNKIKSSACNIKKLVTPENAIIKGTKINATVDNKVNSIVIKVTTSKKASWKLYSDKSCKKLLTKDRMKLSLGTNTVYIKITAENGTSSKIYSLKITRKSE